MPGLDRNPVNNRVFPGNDFSKVAELLQRKPHLASVHIAEGIKISPEQFLPTDDVDAPLQLDVLFLDFFAREILFEHCACGTSNLVEGNAAQTVDTSLVFFMH